MPSLHRGLGPEHSDTESMRNLADVYESQGKYAESVSLYGKTLEIRRRAGGPEHPDTLVSLRCLGDVYYYEGQLAPPRSTDVVGSEKFIGKPNLFFFWREG